MPYVIYGGLLLLYLELGIWQRGIGGIWPIMIGHFCMCAVLFACFTKRLPLVVILVAFALAARVEARTTLLELSLFIALRYGGIDIFVRIFSRRMIIPALIAACLLVFAGLGVLLDAVLHFLDSALNIHEAVRTSTDLTGRTAFWREGWNAYALHPIVGYGANTRVELGSNILSETNAHSGLINLLLDLGLIGLFLFVWWVVSAIHYTQDIGGNPRARRVRLSSSAFLIANIPILVTEPNYIGFFSPGSIALFMCLVLPVTPHAVPLFGQGRLARPAKASNGRGWRKASSPDNQKGRGNLRPASP
jgi:O-antigen ligase